MYADYAVKSVWVIAMRASSLRSTQRAVVRPVDRSLVAFEDVLVRAAAACFEGVRSVADDLVRWAGASAVGALLHLGPATASFSGAQVAMKGLQSHLSMVREVQGAMEGLQASGWRLGVVVRGVEERGGSALDAPGRSTGPDDCLRAVEVLLARSPAPLRRV